MRFSASVTAFLLALPACLAAPSEPQPTQDSQAPPSTMVSYYAQDSNGDRYFLCAGSGGNPTAVYRKTGTVEPGCVFKVTIVGWGVSLESTYAKGTYLGYHGTSLLTLGELGDNYWYTVSYPSDNFDDVLPEGHSKARLAINLIKEATDPKVKTSYYPSLPNAAQGDNQKVTVSIKRSPGKFLIPEFVQIVWGPEDPTAANNPK